MSVPHITTTKATFLPAGTANPWPYPYQFEAKTDLVVYERVIATGVDTLLILDTDYTVSATNDDYSNGATVTPTRTFPATSRIIIDRSESISQLTNITSAAKLPSRTIQDGLDRVTRLVQRLKSDQDRTIRIPQGDTALAEFSDEVSRAGKYLGFDANGVPQASTPDPALITAAKSVTLNSSVIELVNDEDSPGALKTYKTDASGNRGWLSDPIGSNQEALIGTRVSSHADLHAAITDAQANNRPVIIDQVTVVDKISSGIKTLTGAAAVASDTSDQQDLNGISVVDNNSVISINHDKSFPKTGTAQGGTASTIQLAAAETYIDDEINGAEISITAGTGAGQDAIITDYVGSSDTATVSPNWTTTPDATSVYSITQKSTLPLGGIVAIDRGFTKNLLAGNVTDVGGFASFPCTEHSFAPGSTVTIAGTTTYNGAHTIHATLSNASIFVTNTAFGAGDTLTGGGVETVRQEGLVGIPATSHGLSIALAREKVTIAGTTNYNGTYDVHYLTGQYNPHEIIIEATYVAETFVRGGTVTVLNVVIPLSSHGYLAGDTVTIGGTVSYDGTYTIWALGDVNGNNTADNFQIEKLYAAESFGVGDYVVYDITEIQTTEAHTFVANTVAIRGTTNYNGRYKIVSVPDTTTFRINKAYTAENFSTAGTGRVSEYAQSIPDSGDVSIIIPDSRYYLNFQGSMQFTVNAKIFAGEYRIFGMVDDTLTIGHRTDVKLLNGWSYSHLAHWGPVHTLSTVDADITQTTNAWRNCINTGHIVGLTIKVGFGQYTVRMIEEGVDIQTFGLNSFEGINSRASYFQLARWENTPLILMKSRNWHDGRMENIGFYGNDTYNRNMQTDDALLHLEGYTNTLKNVYMRDSGTNGIWYAGGQSNDVVFDRVQVEFCPNGFGIVLQGLNGIKLENCVVEGGLHGVKFLPLTSSSTYAPKNVNATLQCYFEALSGTDVEINGCSGVNIHGCFVSAAGKFVHVKTDPINDIACEDITIDLTAGQNAGGRIDVDADSTKIEIIMPNSTATSSLEIYDSSRYGVVYTRRGKNPYAIPITNRRSGSSELAWSHPCFNGGATLTEPYGDGARWPGSTVFADEVNWLRLNKTGVVVNQNTRWQTNVHSRFFTSELSAALTASTTYYYRLLWNIPINWYAQINVFDVTNNVYYDFYRQHWFSATAVNEHKLSIPGYGNPELVQFPVVIDDLGTRVLRLQASMFLITGSNNTRNFPVIEYHMLTDTIDQGIVHVRNSEIVGYGLGTSKLESIQSTVAVTLKNFERTVFCDTTTTAAFTVTLPALPFDGQKHTIIDAVGGAGAANITVAGNGANIDGAATYVMGTNWDNFTFTYNYDSVAAAHKWIRSK